MKKAELIEKIAKDAGVTKVVAKAALESLLDGVTKGLKKRDSKVTLVGFGTFKKVYRKARKGRNPQTGDPIKIKASNVVKFRAGKQLKAAVGGGTEDTGPKKKMKLSEYKDIYHYYSGKASDVVRQLSFAGIAVVWILKATNISKIPNELLLPLIFFCASLAFDLLHYLFGYSIWFIFYKYKEHRIKDPDVELKHSPILPGILHFCMCIKILTVIIGYYYLIKYVINSLIL